MTIFSNLFGANQQQQQQQETMSKDMSQNLPQTMSQNTNQTETSGLTRQKTNESEEGDHIDLFANVRDIPVAAWHIRGRNKYYNDEEYRKLVEEANSIIFSSIM